MLNNDMKNRDWILVEKIYAQIKKCLTTYYILGP